MRGHLAGSTPCCLVVIKLRHPLLFACVAVCPGPVAQVNKLRTELAAATASLKDNRTAQLETRLTTLADSVVEKQGVIDQLISEKSSLNQRLELERQRRRVAEDALAARQKGGDLDGGDVEEGFSGVTPR